MQPALTISIPTYNRAAKLRAQLERIAPQLSDEAKCCVFDNASTDDTAAAIERARMPHVSYFRATHNAGLVGNIIRCFENCSTEWLWVLGDDDPIAPNAVDRLLASINNCSCDFIQISTPLCRFRSDTLISSAGELLEQSTFPSLVWVSTGVYRVSAFQPLLWLFVTSASTWAPHTVAVLKLLESKKSRILLSSAELITEAPAAARWPTLDFILGFSRLPEYLDDPSDQKRAAERIWQQTVYWALLLGLRETCDHDRIRKWKRTRMLVQKTLKSYGARSPLWHSLRTGFRPGQRRVALRTLHSAAVLTLLSWWPSTFLLNSLKFLPLPGWVRTQLLQNKAYKALY